MIARDGSRITYRWQIKGCIVRFELSFLSCSDDISNNRNGWSDHDHTQRSDHGDSTIIILSESEKWWWLCGHCERHFTTCASKQVRQVNFFTWTTRKEMNIFKSMRRSEISIRPSSAISILGFDTTVGPLPGSGETAALLWRSPAPPRGNWTSLNYWSRFGAESCTPYVETGPCNSWLGKDR